MPTKQPLTNERGIILMVTLAIMAILVVVVLEFSQSMLVDLDISGSVRDYTKAYYLAKGGFNNAVALLREDDNNYDGLDEDWALLKDELLVFEEGTAQVTIIDENSKLNINYLAANKKLKKLSSVPAIKKLDTVGTFKRLLERKGVAREEIDPVVDATIDWLDENDLVSFEGAEESYYTSLETPYPIRNNLLQHISELRLIKNYTDEIFTKLEGETDLYGGIDPGSSRYLTVHSEGLININTAETDLLRALSDDISIDDVEDIMKERETEPFSNITDVRNIVTNENKWNSIKNKISIKSNYYSIISEGRIILNKHADPPVVLTKRIRAIVKRDESKDNHIAVLYWKTE